MSSTQDEALEREFAENCEIIRYLLSRNDEIAAELARTKYAPSDVIFWSDTYDNSRS